MTDDDYRLLERWSTGDSTAAQELTRRYYGGLRRFFEIRVPRVAEDLTQKTLLAAVDAVRRGRVHTAFRAYLFGIARKQLLMHLRDDKRYDELRGFDDPPGGTVHTSLSGVVARRQEQQLLLQALVELPADLQVVVQLYYWEGMPTAEIGVAVEIPASTVTTRLARARELVRRRIEQMRTPPAVRDALLRDLAGWTRSLVATSPQTPPQGSRS